MSADKKLRQLRLGSKKALLHVRLAWRPAVLEPKHDYVRSKSFAAFTREEKTL